MIEEDLELYGGITRARWAKEIEETIKRSSKQMIVLDPKRDLYPLIKEHFKKSEVSITNEKNK